MEYADLSLSYIELCLSISENKLFWVINKAQKVVFQE